MPDKKVETGPTQKVRSKYTSPLQRTVDFAATLTGLPWINTSYNAPDMLDKATSIFSGYGKDYHPEGTRHGSVENVLKGIGYSKFASLLDEDKPYLEQYLHPDVDVLPKREVPSGRPGTLPYREPDYGKLGFEGGGYLNTTGLGGFSRVDETGRLNKDPNKNKYVYDTWDFNTNSPINSVPGFNALSKYFLRQAGQPYAIMENPNRKQPNPAGAVKSTQGPPRY